MAEAEQVAPAGQFNQQSGCDGDAMSNYFIREAEPDDAEPLLAYMDQFLREPDGQNPLAADEFDLTVPQEREFLTGMAERENAIFLLALAEGVIVGEAGLTGGNRRSNRHCARLGISVRRDWRDRGVGTALLQEAIQRARQGGVVTRIELNVFTSNARAIHVYEKLGFRKEGVRRRAMLIQGVYVDGLIMALLL
ncbi:MAG: GNAT family N-acetyltransferase [Chloroflexota bacterium]|nr:GNAT family N-acetyltransferase [Chloroflexota bacterium]